PALTSPKAWKLRARSATVSSPWITISSDRTREESLCVRCDSSRLPAAVFTGTSFGFMAPSLLHRRSLHLRGSGDNRPARLPGKIGAADRGPVTMVTQFLRRGPPHEDFDGQRSAPRHFRLHH